MQLYEDEAQQKVHVQGGIAVCISGSIGDEREEWQGAALGWHCGLTGEHIGHWAREIR
jgi:hypothetical protein